MVNLILNAITKQLGTTFGDSYRYYVENVEQGLRKPCFTVDLLKPIQRSKSPTLYDRTMPIVIHYFGDSESNTKNNCYNVGEQVTECLEYLSVPRFALGKSKLGQTRFGSVKIRGEDVSWQIVDDVLQVFLTYKFTTESAHDVEDAPTSLDVSIAHN